MRFRDPNAAIMPQDIADVEVQLGLRFPAPVRELYLSTNGGIPDPEGFQNDVLDTLVAEFLPLKLEDGDTAIDAYRDLVHVQKIVSTNLFPFAVDAGGDYFFVDTTTSEGRVYFYRHDTASSNPLLDLRVGFEQFWSSLKSGD